MKDIKKILIVSVVLIMCITSLAFAGGFTNSIEVTYRGVKMFINGKHVESSIHPFIYEDNLFVPARLVSEKMGGDITWHGQTNTVEINSYTDFPECDYRQGEIFVYGLITDIDYVQKEITVEQRFDNNSIEIKPSLKLAKDVVIILQRNDKKMNLEPEDLKVGEDVGLILNKEGLVRSIILDK